MKREKEQHEQRFKSKTISHFRNANVRKKERERELLHVAFRCWCESTNYIFPNYFCLQHYVKSLPREEAVELQAHLNYIGINMEEKKAPQLLSASTANVSAIQ